MTRERREIDWRGAIAIVGAVGAIVGGSDSFTVRQDREEVTTERDELLTLSLELVASYKSDLEGCRAFAAQIQDRAEAAPAPLPAPVVEEPADLEDDELAELAALEPAAGEEAPVEPEVEAFDPVELAEPAAVVLPAVSAPARKAAPIEIPQEILERLEVNR